MDALIRCYFIRHGEDNSHRAVFAAFLVIWEYLYTYIVAH